MKKLKKLNLQGNSIGCNGTESLVDSISAWGTNSPLKSLVLNNCKITSGLELLKTLARCPKLECLELSQNPLAGSLKDLPPNTSFRDLQCLYLSQISLTGEDIQALAAVIQNNGMSSLRVFHFGYDKLSDTKHYAAMLNDQPLGKMNLKDESLETLQALKYILGDSSLNTMMDGCENCSTPSGCSGIIVNYIDSELQRRF